MNSKNTPTKLQTTSGWYFKERMKVVYRCHVYNLTNQSTLVYCTPSPFDRTTYLIFKRCVTSTPAGSSELFHLSGK